MKLTAREDIEAPIEAVWETLADFDSFERAALRRGAQVARNDAGGKPGWDISFTYRGKVRRLSVLLDEAEPPGKLRFSGIGKSVEGQMAVDLLELGKRRTRLTVVTEIRPRTLAARLFLQSLKLARSRITRRYQTRIAQVGGLVAQRMAARQRG